MSEEEKIALARLEEKVTGWMETTTEYRKELCRKFKEINDKVSDMPCKEHINEMKWHTNAIYILYCIMGGLIAVVVLLHT
jgi:hypothetical protein